jgi:glycosyltransferase involved in cell wall biosynthesis
VTASAPGPRLKTVFLLPAFVAGGAERVIITLMNNLDRARFAPELVAVRAEGPLRALVAPDIPVHVLGDKGVIPSLPALARQLRRIGPDVAVSTMALTNFALLALKPFLGKTRLIVREAVTPSYILEKHPLAAPAIRAAYRFLYARAETVISPAQVIVDEFARDLRMDTRHHTVLPNPVDTARFLPLPPRAEADHVRFLAAGRLLPQKGFDRLLAALPALPHDTWRLAILGEGPQRAELEALAAGLPNVSLPGHSAAPWPLMAEADAFLLPSRSEGLPNVALEALACGTPVIAMREAGGIAEIAAQAAPGAVKIADTMEEFTALMAQVSPARGEKPSLLPECYGLGNVAQRFEALLLRGL